MDYKRDELHHDLKAVLSASRELSPEHDDALADLFLDNLERHQTLETRKASPHATITTNRTRREMVRVDSSRDEDRSVLVKIAIGAGTVLAFADGITSGGSTVEFLLSWIVTTLLMVALVYVGLGVCQFVDQSLETSRRTLDSAVRVITSTRTD